KILPRQSFYIAGELPLQKFCGIRPINRNEVQMLGCKVKTVHAIASCRVKYVALLQRDYRTCTCAYQCELFTRGPEKTILAQSAGHAGTRSVAGAICKLASRRTRRRTSADLQGVACRRRSGPVCVADAAPERSLSTSAIDGRHDSRAQCTSSTAGLITHSAVVIRCRWPGSLAESAPYPGPQ